MHLTDYNLEQIDDADLQSLDLEGLRHLSGRLLADIKEAHERLKQGPMNRSRPPSRRPPWERGKAAGDPTAPPDAGLVEGERIAANDPPTAPDPVPGANPSPPRRSRGNRENNRGRRGVVAHRC